MKRLLNKKGSVLFLVVVVMSILIIAASATFYIVNNQRSSANVRYSSEQSYQTALSVSDTVSDYIDGYIAAISSSGKEMTKYKDTIIGKMITMSTGTSNDITSDIPLDSSMGAAKVTIRKKDSRTSGDNTIHIFEITTDSEVNGETVTITQVKEIVTGPTEYFTRFLTSTGNHPDDVNITADRIISGAFFENDFTRLSNADMNESLYSSGTFYNNGIKFNAPTKEIVIAENFLNYGFGNVVECGKIYVGGNMESSSAFKADEIYVMGDVILKQDLTGGTYYVNGDVYLDNINTGGCIFYVNGNVYFSNVNKAQGKFYIKKDVVISNWQSNNVEECKYGGTMVGTTTASGFSHDTSIGPPFADTAKISAYIASATGKQKYDKWNVEEYFVKTFTDYVENVDWNPDGSLKKYDIKNAIIPGSEADSYLPGDDNKDVSGKIIKHTYWPDYDGNWSAGMAVCTITESCALRSWQETEFVKSTYVNEWYSQESHFQPNGGTRNYLVIDTGSKRPTGKEIYILLDKGSKDYFSFAGEAVDWEGNPTGNLVQFVNVIIKGDYPVIFILPDGTSYKTSDFMYVGHAGLAADICGCSSYEDFISTQREVFSKFGGKVSQIEGYIDIQPAADPKMQPTALIKSGAGIPDFHNNIFLVSNSYTDIVDMNTMNIFHGYLYAPNSKLNVDLNEGGGGNIIQFLGGMIVGSYHYSNFGGALAYLTPYDYKDVYGLSKKTDIVKQLMSIANGAGGGGGGTLDVIIKPSTGDTPTLGYK